MTGFIGILDAIQDTSKVLLGFLFAWLIFYVQQRYSEKKEKIAVIRAFDMEIKRNALTCEIATSDEAKITYFDMDSWARIKTGNYIPLDKDMIFYIQQIENVNRRISDFLSFEGDYTAGSKLLPMHSDMRLEAKRERLKNSLNELKVAIKIARDTLAKHMVRIK